jgi:hypothetical protein
MPKKVFGIILSFLFYSCCFLQAVRLEQPRFFMSLTEDCTNAINPLNTVQKHATNCGIIGAIT